MNRPRNRQPRPPRSQNGPRMQNRNQPANDSRPAYSSVPTVRQVVAGSQVSIVLKQDQPTGREVQGTVQELLTRGDHPRGIKVRLTDGRVGRVQRMVGDGTAPPTTTTTATQPIDARRGNARGSETWINNESEGPPSRTLADYIVFPDSDTERDAGIPNQGGYGFTTATAKCPICDVFEGDEVAVSRHVEEHLT